MALKQDLGNNQQKARNIDVSDIDRRLNFIRKKDFLTYMQENDYTAREFEFHYGKLSEVLNIVASGKEYDASLVKNALFRAFNRKDDSGIYSKYYRVLQQVEDDCAASMALVMGEKNLPEQTFANLLEQTHRMKIAEILHKTPRVSGTGGGSNPSGATEMRESGTISGWGSYQDFAKYLLDHADLMDCPD